MFINFFLILPTPLVGCLVGATSTEREKTNELIALPTGIVLILLILEHKPRVSSCWFGSWMVIIYDDIVIMVNFKDKARDKVG